MQNINIRGVFIIMKIYPCRVFCDVYFTGCTIIVSTSELTIKFPLWLHRTVKMVFGQFTFKQKNDKEIILGHGQQQYVVYMSKRKMSKFLSFLCNKKNKI